MNKVYTNSWSSLVKFVNTTITEIKADYPTIPIEFLDWDAHGNTYELPNADCIGPLSIGVIQHSPDMYSVSFAIGVSTYSTDNNLFRQRDYISRFFDKMISAETIDYYDADSAVQQSKLVMTDGTVVAPMTKAEVRPWQFVQGNALLLPV